MVILSLVFAGFIYSAVACGSFAAATAAGDRAKQLMLLIPGVEASASLAEVVAGLGQFQGWLPADGHEPGCSLFWADIVEERIETLAVRHQAQYKYAAVSRAGARRAAADQ